MRTPALIGLLLVAIVSGCIGFVAGVNAKEAAPRSAEDIHGDIEGPSTVTPPLTGASLDGPESPSAVANGGGAPTQDPGEAEGGVSSALTGTATWCAPTPRYCQNWGRPAMLGAVNSFHWGDKPYRVKVVSGGRSTEVLVVSHCACPNTLIDLSIEAFDDLAPLSRGRIKVTLETVGARPAITPPTTDQEMP